MAKKSGKTLSELKDKFIGKKGSPSREKYENELRMEVLGRLIRSARIQRNLTQEELGRKIGVGKARISKIENYTNSSSVDTLLRVFKALKANVTIHVSLDGQEVKI